MNEWISVKDRLPKNDSGTVFVYGPWGIAECFALARWYNGEWNELDSGYTLHDVSHWMPLPEPPEEIL